MPKPNFFLIGAARSGTTAMAEHLAAHPKIYLTSPKEPYYWSRDFAGIRSAFGYSNEADYLALFGAAAEAPIQGEASTTYLMSEVAVPAILDFNPQAKFLVLLRNPIHAVYAFHSQLVYTNYEDLEDFEVAWDLQARRSEGHQIPAGCFEPRMLQYREVAAFGTQLERATKLVPEGQLLVLFHEDMTRDPSATYRQVLAFLNLEDDGREQIERVNEAAKIRVQWLGKLVMHPSYQRAAQWVKRRLPLGWVRRLQRAKNSAVAEKVQRAPLSTSFHNQLVDSFAGEIDKMATLTGRDLKHWLARESRDE